MGMHYLEHDLYFRFVNKCHSQIFFLRYSCFGGYFGYLDNIVRSCATNWNASRLPHT